VLGRYRVAADRQAAGCDRFLGPAGRDQAIGCAKPPRLDAMTRGLLQQLALPVRERTSYALIWLADGDPIGHCNTNPTRFVLEDLETI
jgi:hypothetical protein